MGTFHSFACGAAIAFAAALARPYVGRWRRYCEVAAMLHCRCASELGTMVGR